MANIIKIILRGLQLFWTVLILALVGNMIHDSPGGDPAVVNFVMFVAVLGLFTLLYLIPATVKESFVIFGFLPIVLDGLNTLFFFIGGVALAAKLGVHSCHNEDYTKNNIVTRGSPNDLKRCQEGQASCAFLWFGFACFAATLFLNLVGGDNVNLRAGIRRPGAPSMSQV